MGKESAEKDQRILVIVSYTSKNKVKEAEMSYPFNLKDIITEVAFTFIL